MNSPGDAGIKKLTGGLALSFVIIGICILGLMAYVS